MTTPLTPEIHEFEGDWYITFPGEVAQCVNTKAFAERYATVTQERNDIRTVFTEIYTALQDADPGVTLHSNSYSVCLDIIARLKQAAINVGGGT